MFKYMKGLLLVILKNYLWQMTTVIRTPLAVETIFILCDVGSHKD